MALVIAEVLDQTEVVRLVQLFRTACRRPRNDQFFESTNEFAGIGNVPGLRRLGVYSTLEDVDDNDGPSQAIGGVTTSTNKTHCNVPGCNRILDNVQAYERHYSRMHRFQCSQCHRMIASDHLLDLHLSEQHDSFFAAKVSAHRERAFYACLIKECTRFSFTPEERKDHCIREHSFPPQFRFETKKTPLLDAPSSVNCPDTIRISQHAKQKTNGSVHFVNFGHSKQKTFASAKHVAEDVNYAKVLTQSQLNVSDQPSQALKTSDLEAKDILMGDIMDCLDDL